MKSIFQSKTFWLATVQALAGVVFVYASAFPEFGWLAIVKSGVDIFLRYQTTTTIQ